MSRKIFRSLKTVDEVKDILARNTSLALGRILVPLDVSLGRIIFEDIFAAYDTPGFDRASMDGFAVLAEDTFRADETNPVQLKIVGKIEVGKKPSISIQRGECAEISTGAPIPKGANAVVMVEYTETKGSYVSVIKPAVIGLNIQAAGSDIMRGELILRKNQVVTSREIGVAAAVGISKLPVYAKPKVAVISTGDEIAPIEAPLEYGKIYDINAYTIMAAIIEAGGEPHYLGIAKDDRHEIEELLVKAIGNYDIVLTSGSTSAGFGDIMYNLLNSLGKPGVLVHGVAIKPGKPTIIAVVGKTLIFGLPGYPTSALSIFNVFVKPLILQLSGKKQSINETVNGTVAQKIISETGRRELLPVNLAQKGTEYYIYPVLKGSGAISTLAEADGFIEIPENRIIIEEGTKINVQLFTNLTIANLMIIGSHCIGLDLLLSILQRRYEQINSKVINTGSIGGVYAIERGEADIAGIHILDAETGEYNLPFLRTEKLSNQAVLIRGYIRQQGIILPKGNPKKIRGIEDVFDKKLSIINRVKGSGTRILLDALINEFAMTRGLDPKHVAESVPGYNIEAKTHSSVAIAVKYGKADAGIGIQSVSHNYDLEFIPLKEEKYDFLVLKNRLTKTEVKSFINTLNDDEFHKILEDKVKGIKVTEETGSILNI